MPHIHRSSPPSIHFRLLLQSHPPSIPQFLPASLSSTGSSLPVAVLASLQPLFRRPPVQLPVPQLPVPPLGVKLEHWNSQARKAHSVAKSAAASAGRWPKMLPWTSANTDGK